MIAHLTAAARRDPQSQRPDTGDGVIVAIVVKQWQAVRLVHELRLGFRVAMPTRLLNQIMVQHDVRSYRTPSMRASVHIEGKDYATKQRIRVTIDETLTAETLAYVQAATAVASSGLIPAPLVDSAKCPRCSLVGICLPDETRRAMALDPPAAGLQLRLFSGPELEEPPLDEEERDTTELRRLVPARDDLRPLYVTGFGLTVGESDEILQIKEKGKLVREARIHEISQVNVFGAVTVTGPALQSLCWAEKPVAHFTAGG